MAGWKNLIGYLIRFQLMGKYCVTTITNMKYFPSLVGFYINYDLKLRSGLHLFDLKFLV